MSDKPKAAAVLRSLLAGTRPDEVDCDRFLECLAPFLDGRLDDAELREKLEHHVRQCPECSEELAIVKKALEP